MEAVRKNGNNEWIIQSKHPYIKYGIPITFLIGLALTISGWIYAAGGKQRIYDDTVGKVPIIENKVINLDVRVTGIEHDLKSFEKIPEQLQTVQNNQRQVLTDLDWIKKNINK